MSIKPTLILVYVSGKKCSFVYCCKNYIVLLQVKELGVTNLVNENLKCAINITRYDDFHVMLDIVLYLVSMLRLGQFDLPMDLQYNGAYR